MTEVPPEELFAVRLRDDFDQRAGRVFPGPEGWAHTLMPLFEQLEAVPTLYARQLGGNAWTRTLTDDPTVFVYFTIDFEERVVVVTDIRRGGEAAQEEA